MKVYFLTAVAHQESFGSILEKFLEDEKHDELAAIKAKITHIACYGGHPQMPHARPIREVNGEINEIRGNYSKEELLRIYYFVDRPNKTMVLMNVTIKPSGRKFASKYEGKNKKNMDKKIQKNIALALEIKSKYLISSHDYEQLCV